MRFARPLIFGLLALALLGLPRARIATNLTDLYAPPPDLLAADCELASSAAATNAGLLVVAGEAYESALAALYAEQGPQVAAALGLETLSPPPALPDFVLPCDACPTNLPPGVTFCQPRTLLAERLAAWTHEARSRLAVSLLLMALVLACVFRARAVRVFGPSLLALLAVAGVLGWLGRPITLFHLLAGFLLAGMSVDYTVFLSSASRGTLRPVLCALLTSLAGFGALAFVSFSVVRAFGLTLGLGLPVAFLTALAWRPAASHPAAKGASVELGASATGLAILGWLTRLFGGAALRLCAAGVGLFLWLVSPQVRRAAHSPRRLLSFVRALADKFVIMSGARGAPRVCVPPDDASTQAFLADIRAGTGVFILSSHCGLIEALALLGEDRVTLHAWMDFDRTSVFSDFYLRHIRRASIVIHPVSEIGLETSFWASDALARGDCLLMAGDRGAGAFRFAHAMGHPAYFVACLWTRGAYRVIARRLPPASRDMATAFAAHLHTLTERYPDQWHDWH